MSELPRFHNISSPNSNCCLQSEFFALWHLHSNRLYHSLSLSVSVCAVREQCKAIMQGQRRSSVWGVGHLTRAPKNDHELQESFRESMWPATPNKVIILTTHSGFMLQASSLRLCTPFGRNSLVVFLTKSTSSQPPSPSKKRGLLPKNETN